jgi:hypothetical protein
MRRLGERLDKLGGFALMQKVCDNVRKTEYETAAIDNAWHGVGTWFA